MHLNISAPGGPGPLIGLFLGGASGPINKPPSPDSGDGSDILEGLNDNLEGQAVPPKRDDKDTAAS